MLHQSLKDLLSTTMGTTYSESLRISPQITYNCKGEKSAFKLSRLREMPTSDASLTCVSRSLFIQKRSSLLVTQMWEYGKTLSQDCDITEIVSCSLLCIWYAKIVLGTKCAPIPRDYLKMSRAHSLSIPILSFPDIALLSLYGAFI